MEPRKGVVRRAGSHVKIPLNSGYGFLDYDGKLSARPETQKKCKVCFERLKVDCEADDASKTL